jgi:hypothetical protein
LSFVSRVVFELLRSPLWHSDHGYVTWSVPLVVRT